jgi:hypothetical protein
LGHRARPPEPRYGRATGRSIARRCGRAAPGRQTIGGRVAFTPSDPTHRRSARGCLADPDRIAGPAGATAHGRPCATPWPRRSSPIHG